MTKISNDSHDLRVAQTKDANQLAVLASQVWMHTYAKNGVSSIIADYVLAELTPAKFSEMIADPLRFVVVAEKEDNLLGFAVIHVASQCPYAEPRAIELATLYVQAHFIGTGLGKALIQAAESWAKSEHQSTLWLKVNAQNLSAIQFYQHLGYTKADSVDFILGGKAYENYVMVPSPVNKRALTHSQNSKAI